MKGGGVKQTYETNSQIFLKFPINSSSYVPLVFVSGNFCRDPVTQQYFQSKFPQKFSKPPTIALVAFWQVLANNNNNNNNNNKKKKKKKKKNLFNRRDLICCVISFGFCGLTSKEAYPLEWNQFQRSDRILNEDQKHRFLLKRERFTI